MKKLLALILILALVPVIALGETDLSDYSLEQLEYLRKIICEEILSRSEWESVTVPPGFYVVGEDIPAGHWTIKYGEEKSWAIIQYFSKTDDTGKSPDILYGSFYQANIGAPGNELETLYDMKEIDLDLKSGYYITIQFSSVVFEPFTGRESPFF